MKTIIKTDDGRKYERLSRWIHLETRYITKRHTLYDYADTYSADTNGIAPLTCFRYSGRVYALNQFERFLYPEFFTDTDGKNAYLSGYDCTQWYKPLICEIDSNGEYIRLYQELTN